VLGGLASELLLITCRVGNAVKVEDIDTRLVFKWLACVLFEITLVVGNQAEELDMRLVFEGLACVLFETALVVGNQAEE